MSVYRLNVPIYADAYAEVEVPDEVEAEGFEAVNDYVTANADLPSLCAQCGGWGSHEGIELGEADWGNETIEKLR